MVLRSNVMKNRWYDQDPTLSLAISLLRNANSDVRLKCADLIIAKAKEFKVVIQSNILEKFDFTLRRWYDENPKLTEALEYLRYSNFSLRKKIALDVIEFLQMSEIL